MFEVPALSRRSASTFELDRKTQDHNRYGEVKTRLTIDFKGYEACGFHRSCGLLRAFHGEKASAHIAAWEADSQPIGRSPRSAVNWRLRRSLDGS
jgi:hypothetical protein